MGGGVREGERERVKCEREERPREWESRRVN